MIKKTVLPDIRNGLNQDQTWDVLGRLITKADAETLPKIIELVGELLSESANVTIRNTIKTLIHLAEIVNE